MFKQIGIDEAVAGTAKGWIVKGFYKENKEYGLE